MRSFAVWKSADEPNYTTNIDQMFPYSDLPNQGEYKLVKIPGSLNHLIKHVDYWGEGRVVSKEGIKGFPNCYNINHQYQLVSSGSDIDKKIPNRIPVRGFSMCDTSVYIKDNSVLTVTVSRESILRNCAKDIARIINSDHGIVVVYGAHGVSPDIFSLVLQLGKKGLYPHKDATLPSELQGLTYFGSHVVFLKINNIGALQDALFNYVQAEVYDDAVSMSTTVMANAGAAIKETVEKLISPAAKKVMLFAYTLWHGGAEDIVRNHFPDPFQHILSEDAVTIVNKQYQQALKLDSKIDPTNNDRAIWGDKRLPKTSGRLSWRFVPTYNDDVGDLTFQLYNIDCNMFMRMNDAGDTQCWGSNRKEENSDDNSYKFYLEPLIGHDGDLEFFIISRDHEQVLTLEEQEDNFKDILLWGDYLPNFKEDHDVNDRYRWVIAPWSSCH